MWYNYSWEIADDIVVKLEAKAELNCKHIDIEDFDYDWESNEVEEIEEK